MVVALPCGRGSVTLRQGFTFVPRCHGGGRICGAFMNLEGIHVLLVEDNPGDARLFLELVRDTGAGPGLSSTSRT